MSYNIDNMQCKNLVLKLSKELIEETEWLDLQYSSKTKKWTLEGDDLPEIFDIDGKMEGDDFVITNISIAGEWSGTFWNDYMLPLFEKAKANGKFLITWEGGDTIETETFKNGIKFTKDMKKADW